jgi:hypothetical protein
VPESARRIDAVIKDGLAPALKTQGYRKERRTFRRRGAQCTRVVNVQGSQWNAEHEGRFTLNLAVYFPAVVPFLDWARATDRPTEADCVVRERIGFVMPVRQDHWWQVTAETDLGALAREVCEAWEEFGAPWLDTHADLEAARTFALSQKLPSWAAAVSLALSEPRAARGYLEEALAAAKASPTITAQLRDWAGRHAISLEAAV